MFEKVSVTDESSQHQTDKLVCIMCKRWCKNSLHVGITCKPCDEYTAAGTKMDRSFSNLKIVLSKHLISDAHQTSLTTEKNNELAKSKVKDGILKSMRHWAYFTLKSGLSLEQFPSLLATANVCGLELGDINHSRLFITQFLELIDIELVKKLHTGLKNKTM